MIFPIFGFFLDAIISEYTHPNIFLMLFLKLQQKTDVMFKKSDVTHVTGRFSKKRLSAFRTDRRTPRVRTGYAKKKKIFFFLLLF